MELIQIKDNTWALAANQLIPVFRLGGGRCRRWGRGGNFRSFRLPLSLLHSRLGDLRSDSRPWSYRNGGGICLPF